MGMDIYKHAILHHTVQSRKGAICIAYRELDVRRVKHLDRAEINIITPCLQSQDAHHSDRGTKRTGGKVGTKFAFDNP